MMMGASPYPIGGYGMTGMPDFLQKIHMRAHELANGLTHGISATGVYSGPKWAYKETK